MADEPEQTQSSMSAEERARRIRKRNVALAVVLGGLMALFFIITIAKLGGNVANRPVVGDAGKEIGIEVAGLGRGLKA